MIAVYIVSFYANVTKIETRSYHFRFSQSKPDKESYVAVLKSVLIIARTLREDQPLRLLLNLLFYHFNRSEPTYKSQRIRLLDVIAACIRLNVKALN